VRGIQIRFRKLITMMHFRYESKFPANLTYKIINTKYERERGRGEREKNA